MTFRAPTAEQRSGLGNVARIADLAVSERFAHPGSDTVDAGPEGIGQLAVGAHAPTSDVADTVLLR